MLIKEKIEKIEEETLSKKAILSNKTKGRRVYEKSCEIRTEFQRDRDRIIHSKSFRRLMYKTQVFIFPGDHYRTRLTHTLEVSQIARTIARALRMNEDLTEAIALAHDLGHTPFGHAGETALDDILKNKGGFSHNKQSLRVVDLLEKNGKGLNLTYEVRNGIYCHTGNKKPLTLEGNIVKISDRIAYLNHDIDDALRGKILKLENLPKSCRHILGEKYSERINSIIFNIIKYSKNKFFIDLDPNMKKIINDLREFMFKNVYINEYAKKEQVKIKRLIKGLFDYYKLNIDLLPNEYLISKKYNKEKKIVDYIAGMTDNFAIQIFKKIYFPINNKNLQK